MSDADKRLKMLAARRRPGWSLEQEFYVDADVFALDLHRIYGRHWLLAGSVSRIPAPGDWFAYAIGNDSVAILRDDEGHVRAFHNVCRHRGSRICLEEDGNAKRLVCPYHNWTYRLDGSLASARHLPDDLDRSEFGLHPVHVQVVGGLIFICTAEVPPDFETTAADIAEFLAPFQLERTQICCQTTETIRANWKVVAENFWECYHCQTTHPEFSAVMSYAHAQNNPRLADERRAFEQQWEADTRARGGKVGRIELTNRGLHQGGRVPIRRGWLTQSEDGQPVAPLLGELTEYDGAVTSFMHFPLLWYVVSNDHAVLTRFTPLSPLETELELTWLVREGAVEGQDYDADSVCWMWRVTAQQDKAICENNQLGILSSRYEPGPYVTTESSVDDFVTWYLKELCQP